MAKLVEIAAAVITEWPEGISYITQDLIDEWGGRLSGWSGKDDPDFCKGIWCSARGHDWIQEWWDIADDCHVAKVTRAQWEAERARIAEAKAAIEKRAEELSRCGMGVLINDVHYTNQQAAAEAREIARTDTMTAEEQELSGIACGKRIKEDQALWDKVAAAAIQALSASQGANDDRAEWMTYIAEDVCDIADAFMAERAKRLKGV